MLSRVFTALVMALTLLVVFVGHVVSDEAKVAEEVADPNASVSALAGSESAAPSAFDDGDSKNLAPASVKVFMLKNANAESVKGAVSSLFRSDQRLRECVADERTNQLLVTAEAELFESIGAVVEVLDQSVAPKNTTDDPFDAGPPKSTALRVTSKDEDKQYEFEFVPKPELRESLKQYRKLNQKLGKDHPDLARAKEAIVEQVTEAFQHRQSQQKAKLDQLQLRIRQLAERIELREKRRAEIIDHQVSQLVDNHVAVPAGADLDIVVELENDKDGTADGVLLFKARTQGESDRVLNITPHKESAERSVLASDMMQLREIEIFKKAETKALQKRMAIIQQQIATAQKRMDELTATPDAAEGAKSPSHNEARDITLDKLKRHIDVLTEESQQIELHIQAAVEAASMREQRQEITSKMIELDAQKAEAALDAAKRFLERQTQLAQSGVVTDQELDAARQDLQNAEIELKKKQIMLEHLKSDDSK